MKSVLRLCILALLVTACRHSPPEARHIEPEKRSTEAEIRRHIVGIWDAKDLRDCWYPTLMIAEDGSLSGVQTNGHKELIGTWEMYGASLRVTYHSNCWYYYPVIYADDHELVMTPGISVAGRWRYKR